MPRWHMVCDACGVSAWIGARLDGVDAWCEGCQTGLALPAGRTSGECRRCGLPVTVSEPRFEELFGELQNVAAVLAAWDGEPGPLGALLPDRPRFLTDLHPPAPRPEDSADVRKALEHLAAGAFGRAGALLESVIGDPSDRAQAPDDRAVGDPRLWLAFGIAAQRTRKLSAAEAAFARTLELAPDHVPARLARGALRARRGDYSGARDDFARGGADREGRWNRAALAILESVAARPEPPAPEVLESARAEVGTPSSYWSDHTVGRLLWTALVEHHRDAARASRPVAADGRALERAESELEFQTFWDRALVVHGYAVLGMRRDLERVAQPLVIELLDQIAAEPFLRGAAGKELRAILDAAMRSVRQGEPAAARHAIERLLERNDLRHYRVPCLHCGAGSTGVDAIEEDDLAEAGETRD